MGDGVFVFDCLSVWKNATEKYVYTVNEGVVPDGYNKEVEGYTVTNTRL